MPSLEEELRNFNSFQRSPPPPDQPVRAIPPGSGRNGARRHLVVGTLGALVVALATVAILSNGPKHKTPVVTLSPEIGSFSSSVQGSSSTTARVVDLEVVSDELRAEFPATFGGLTSAPEQTITIYVVGPPDAVRDTAEHMLGKGYTIVTLPSEHSLQDMFNLKNQIESDRDMLIQSGIPLAPAMGIRIEEAGPRVLVGVAQDTPSVEAMLHARYGATTLTILQYSGIIEQSGH